MNSFHVIDKTSIEMLAQAYSKGRPVRFWLNAYNEIVGTWLAPNGQTIAVGGSYLHKKKIVYRTMTPFDKWSGGGKLATVEAMTAYREREIEFYSREREAQEDSDAWEQIQEDRREANHCGDQS